MLRPLPVRDPQQLVEFLNKYPGEPHVNAFSWKSYLHFLDHNHVLTALIGSAPAHLTVRAEGLDPEIVDGEPVVSNFFPVLGVTPAAAPAVAVVSWSYWKSRFNLAILGKRLVVDDVPVTVIGVAPRAFFGLRAGVPVALWARRFAASLIPGLPLNSVFPIAASAVAMLAIAVLAAWLPARRAARVDPVNSLRYE